MYETAPSDQERPPTDRCGRNPRNVFRRERDHGIQDRDREADPHDRADGGEDQTLGDELAQQVAGRRAQAEAQRHFAAAARCACRLEPAQVDAGDQQQADRPGEQQGRDDPAATEDVIAATRLSKLRQPRAPGRASRTPLRETTAGS